MLSRDRYNRAVRARRALQVADCPAALAKRMKSLSETGWDGDYVVPNQLSSASLTGPVILLNNWYGWEALDTLDTTTREDLKTHGYLRGVSTNRWLDRALDIVGLARSDVYITQACVFLPRMPTGSSVPPEAYEISVERILKNELAGRTPVALGSAAQRACSRSQIDYVGAKHPSYQGGERRAREIAAAIRRVLE